jgi:hypothetical protein
MPPPRTFECSVCGKDIPAKAKACPHCGACEKSGWNEESDATDGLDLPDDDFDYEKFTAEEFGQSRKKRGKEWLWWVTALILLIVIAATTAYNMLFQQ